MQIRIANKYASKKNYPLYRSAKTAYAFTRAAGWEGN